MMKGEVETFPISLEKASHDASIFDIRPKLVLFPKDSEDVKNLVKWVSENKQKYPELSITARCAGTDMSGGAIGESLILDFTRYMNSLIRWNEFPKNSSGLLQPSAGTFPVQNSLNFFLRLKNANWISVVPEANKNYTAQIRYHGEFLPCTVKCAEPGFEQVIFKKPILVASGQSCVVYDGDVCLGGGVVV